MLKPTDTTVVDAHWVKPTKTTMIDLGQNDQNYKTDRYILWLILDKTDRHNNGLCSVKPTDTIMVYVR